jgi:hypothetical protein
MMIQHSFKMKRIPRKDLLQLGCPGSHEDLDDISFWLFSRGIIDTTVLSGPLDLYELEGSGTMPAEGLKFLRSLHFKSTNKVTGLISSSVCKKRKRRSG